AGAADRDPHVGQVRVEAECPVPRAVGAGARRGHPGTGQRGNQLAHTLPPASHVRARSRSFTRSRAGPRARIRDITRTGWTNRDNSGTRGAVSRDKRGRAAAAAPAVAAAAPAVAAAAPAIAAAPAAARDDHL